MITVKIHIKEHLREYLIGKFCQGEDVPVRFPDKLDIYHLLHDLTERRPAGAIDTGNIDIALPEPHNSGKKSASFNYLGVRSQRIIEQKIEVMMWAEIHDLLEHDKHMLGLKYNETVYCFMKRYGIQALSEDAFIKNYYRYRDNIRRRKLRRNYTRVKND